jgi:hypothetical protein
MFINRKIILGVLMFSGVCRGGEPSGRITYRGAAGRGSFARPSRYDRIPNEG